LNDASVVLANAVPGTVDTSWTVKVVGDFNGDGSSDLFGQRTDGATSIWFMNGTQRLASGWPPAVGVGWEVQVAADVDADGKSDLLWRHTDGSTRVWLMDGLSVRLNVALQSVDPRGRWWARCGAP